MRKRGGCVHREKSGRRTQRHKVGLFRHLIKFNSYDRKLVPFLVPINAGDCVHVACGISFFR
jgi:hypothetical protein